MTTLPQHVVEVHSDPGVDEVPGEARGAALPQPGDPLLSRHPRHGPEHASVLGLRHLAHTLGLDK